MKTTCKASNCYAPGSKNQFRSILLIALLFISQLALSQVGINTTTPKATLEVRGETDISRIPDAADGIIAPIVTKSELASKNIGIYAVDQAGALVYVSDASGGTSGPSVGQVTQIDTVGYYYFNGSDWVPMTYPISVSNLKNGENLLATQVEGVVGNYVSIIDSATMQLSGNNLNSIINGHYSNSLNLGFLQLYGDTQGFLFDTRVRRINGSPLGDLSSAVPGNALTFNGSSWVPQNPKLQTIPGNLPTSPVPPVSTTRYTGAYITLPPGQWMVAMGSTVATASTQVINSDCSLWVTVHLSDVSTGAGPVTPDVLINLTGFRGSATTLGRGMNRASLNGYTGINNTSGANKTYYLWVNREVYGSASCFSANYHLNTPFHSGFWERYLFAIPIQ